MTEKLDWSPMRQPDGISVTGNSCNRADPERTVCAFPSDSTSKTERGIHGIKPGSASYRFLSHGLIGIDPDARGHSGQWEGLFRPT